MSEHGMTCAKCHRRLLPGGKEDQRPYPVLVTDYPTDPALSFGDRDALPAIYELRCARCARGDA